MPQTIEQCVSKFWDRVQKTDGCWIWIGPAHLHGRGYGAWKILGQTKKPHRISWELKHGPISDGLHCLHKCDTPKCVNPEHLFLGTHKDNMVDAAKKRRLRTPDQRGEKHSGHKLNAAQVRLIRLLARSGHTHTHLGCLFQISRSVISRITSGALWSTV